jgi:dienelactone hydrolase
MLWGNGGCSADATGQAPFLQQLASYGVLVIASGTPKGGGSTTSQVMRQSIDWITQQAGKGNYANVDASRIVAAGWSCGGVEAYDQIWDSRVSAIGIWSSGLLTNYTAAKSFNKPVFFFLGGSGDIAYANVSFHTC